MTKIYAHTSRPASTDTGSPIADPEDSTGIIPFADEIESSTTTLNASAPRVEDMGASATEEFGAVERSGSIVDRDLGLDRAQTQMRVVDQRSGGRYACPCCGKGAGRVVRVRVASQPSWVALCAVCAASMLVRYPGTIVGGMVRPTRRRRTNRTRIERKYAHGFRAGAQRGSLRRAG